MEIEEMKETLSGKKDSLKLKEAKLNTGFFIIGSFSELRDNGVIEREGGILGIGSTHVVSEDFSKDLFKTVDIREFNYLHVNSR